MTMFVDNEDYEIKASLHYKDHPMVASTENYIYLNGGTRTIVDVSIEEVINTLKKPCPVLLNFVHCLSLLCPALLKYDNRMKIFSKFLEV